MRAVIGDSAFNRRFLGAVVTACGFDEIAGAATAERLIREAARADLVVYDPQIERAGSTIVDVGMDLLRVVSRHRLVVVSSSAKERERARLNGIVAATKGSILRLHDIETAIRFAMCQHDQAADARTAAAGYFDTAWDDRVEPAPSAYASVLRSELESTYQP
jgi:hypothetical protein